MTRRRCKTSTISVDGEIVWSWPPDAEAKLHEGVNVLVR